MDKHPIQLIVGLANPGSEYEKTRHNAGAWFVEALIRKFDISLKVEPKFKGVYGQIYNKDRQLCHILIPTTFMNLSGQSIQAIASFYKIPINAILVAHDELDLPAGTIRLKMDGGHGGHNGLRHTIEQLGTNAFYRLRIGINHPGHRDKVVDYVLSRPSKEDSQKIYHAIDNATQHIDTLLAGDIQKAMRDLHT